MSKIVVGMNSRPAIIPHRIDCGLRKTRPMRAGRAPQPVVAAASAAPAGGSSTKSSDADDEAGDAHADPEAAPGHARARSAGRPRTGRRSRRPCRTSASRRSAWRRARRGSWWWRCRRRPPARRRRPRPAGGGRRSPACRCPCEQQRADADRRRADRHHPARPQPVHRHAGDQAERRVAVVEQADHRRHAHRAQAERLGQLRHHDGRRRAQHVLVEVVHGRDQPRDAGRLERRCIECSPVLRRRRPALAERHGDREAAFRGLLVLGVHLLGGQRHRGRPSCRSRRGGWPGSRCSRS